MPLSELSTGMAMAEVSVVPPAVPCYPKHTAAGLLSIFSPAARV